MQPRATSPQRESSCGSPVKECLPVLPAVLMPSIWMQPSQSPEHWPVTDDSAARQAEEGLAAYESCATVDYDDHTQCQLEIEALRAKLQYYKDTLTPSAMAVKLTEQINSWKELERLRKRELAHIQELSSHLQNQIHDVQRTKSLLLSQLESIRTLESRMRQEPLKLPLSAIRDQHSPESFTGSDISVTPRMPSQSHTDRSVSPLSLTDSHLQGLNLRLQHILGQLGSDDGDPKAIEAEISDIETSVEAAGSGKKGVSRLRMQINTAKNRLIRMRSMRAISGADRMLSSLQNSLKAAERSFSHLPDTMSLKGEENDDSPLSHHRPKTDRGELQRWSGATEEVSSQATVIADLQDELQTMKQKMQEVEKREQELKRRECFQGVILNLLQGKSGKNTKPAKPSS